MSSTPKPTALDRIDTWIFDLDNTLYPADCDLFAQVHRRMGSYVADRLGLELDAARALQRQYFLAHGTTLRGLMLVNDIDPGDYLTYVHDIDVSVVGPDTRLAAALAALPGRKIIYTNASLAHAERVLRRLGLAGQFDHIEDIVAADFVPKPAVAPYGALIDRQRIDPARSIMVEDIAKNLAPARAFGMTTAWVRTGPAPGGAPEPGEVDFVIDDLAGFLEGIGLARHGRRHG